MKLPNFRLYDTQAKAGVVFGVAALLCSIVLVFVVFKGFKAEDSRIYYNAAEGLGKWRRPIIMIGTVIGCLVGGAAGVLGFNSLGQKRNNKQGLSWMGVVTGAITVVASIVLFFAWSTLSEPIIAG